MSADMTIEPWTRLAKLAPPGADPNDLQAAADRYALTADLYAAVADLWEEKAMTIDVSPPPASTEDALTSESVSQDGITVAKTYARGVINYSQNQQLAQYASYMRRARYYRGKAKVKTALLDGRAPVDIFDPEQMTDYYDQDHIIPVID